jgi:hypothetical protein
MKARAPTVPEEEADVVKLKHDFAEKFDRPLFTGTSWGEQLYHKNGKEIKGDDGKPKRFELPRDKGESEPAFVRKHKLSAESHPADFVEVLSRSTQTDTTSQASSTRQSKHGRGIPITRPSALKLVLEGQCTPTSCPSA